MPWQEADGQPVDLSEQNLVRRLTPGTGNLLPAGILKVRQTVKPASPDDPQYGFGHASRNPRSERRTEPIPAVRPCRPRILTDFAKVNARSLPRSASWPSRE